MKASDTKRWTLKVLLLLFLDKTTCKYPFLFFTGFSRFSSDIQKGTEKAMKDKTAQLLEMYKIVDDAEKILTDKHTDIDEFGRLLDYTWKLKRGISGGISTDSIDEQYDRAMKAGALGGKLLGAGGGGFLLFYVPKDKQEAVKNALEGQIYVPFKFENEGTKVLYFNPEEYHVHSGEAALKTSEELER